MRVSCLLLAWFVVSLGAQQPNISGRVADLNFISNEIPKLAPYFLAHLDRGEFQAAVSNLNSKLGSATDNEFYTGLAHLVAMAGDGHTQLYLNVAPVYAIRLRSLDDGLFITSAGARYAQTVGTQLHAIRGVPIDEAIQRIAPVVSHENEAGLHSVIETYARTQIVLRGVGLVPPDQSADLTFRSLAGDEFTLAMAGEVGPAMAATAPDPAAGPVPLYLQSQNLNYWFTYSAQSELLYFKYNACVDMSERPFKSFASDLLRMLDSNIVRTFVFDFRGNGGGSNMLWNPLLDGFRQRLPSLMANPNFRVYVVFDKRSFSAAVDNPMRLLSPTLVAGVDTRRVIRTIGEPAGQAPEMYGNTVQFTLPGKPLYGWYSTTFFQRPAWIPPGPELIPDLPVGVRSTDYFARFDPVMAAILAGSAPVPAAPSGDIVTLNGASLRPSQGLAPAAIATAFGNFSAIPDEVVVSGVTARMTGASTSQVNFIVPESLSPGRTTIVVRAAGHDLASGEATVSPVAPGLFVSTPADPSQPGAVLNEDSSLNNDLNPAPAGSVIRIFATGLGASAGDVLVFFNERPAEVVESLSPAPGLWQIAVRLPTGIEGQIGVFVAAGNVPSNGITIQVK